MTKHKKLKLSDQLNETEIDIPTLEVLLEQTQEKEHDEDLLYKNGMYFLFDDIDQHSAKALNSFIVRQNIDGNLKNDKITIFLQSDGGCPRAMFSMIDCINSSKKEVIVYGTGSISSAGFFLFACAKKGNRFLTPNCDIMAHQPSLLVENSLKNVSNTVNNLTRARNWLLSLLLKNGDLTKQEIEEKLLSDDNYYSPREIKKMGFCDKIQNISFTKL